MMASLDPGAVVWFGLCLALILAATRFRKLTIWTLLSVAVLYGVCGNGWFAYWMMNRLERDFREFDPLELEPLDALVVLGGGTTIRSNGTIQLTGSGDRVMLAARLYHLGKAKKLIATGGANPDIGQFANAADTTRQLWQDIGVPATDIVCIPGQNTHEEIFNARRHLAGTGARRIGLLTSAWHLQRALRLAKRNGIDAVPVPAEFQSNGVGPLLFALIPSAGNLQKTYRACLEHLGMLMER
jgi:uncharacterized SAM-binding protein YcdF (DUF218 family)